jgi:hypothetical protein
LEGQLQPKELKKAAIVACDINLVRRCQMRCNISGQLLRDRFPQLGAQFTRPNSRRRISRDDVICGCDRASEAEFKQQNIVVCGPAGRLPVLMLM